MKVWYCVYCGQENSIRAKKCKSCGLIHSASPEGQINNELNHIRKCLSEKYDVIEEIGRGGMSIVYKALHKGLNKFVALKIIHPDLMKNSAVLEQFRIEASTAGSISHPNIIHVYDIGELNGIYYISLEFLHGTNLHEYIKKNGPLTKNEFRRIFIQLAGALQELENHEMVHRDIKSSNIIITSEGKPVLMDFGIASIKSKRSTNGEIYLTPEYMSPEQVDDFLVDERSDLYSLGMVMYEAITGAIPYKGMTHAEILEFIQKPELTEHLFTKGLISNRYSSILKRLLQHDPEKRFQSGNELRSALEKGSMPFVNLKTGLLYVLLILLGLIAFGSVVYIIYPDLFQKRQSKDISTTVPQDQIHEAESDTDIIRTPVKDSGQWNHYRRKTQTPVTIEMQDDSKYVKETQAKPDYDQLLIQGANAFGNGETEDAEKIFIEASKLRPDDTYPKTMLEKIKQDREKK